MDDKERELGICYRHMTKKEYATAIRELKALLEKEPKFLKAWNLLGICYEKLGRHEEAVEFFDKAIGAEPGDFFAYAEKAKCLFIRQQPGKALPLFEKAAELAGDREDKAELLVEAGLTHILLKDKKAADAFKKAFRIHPRLTVDDIQIIFDEICLPADIPQEKKISIQESINRLREQVREGAPKIVKLGGKKG